MKKLQYFSLVAIFGIVNVLLIGCFTTKHKRPVVVHEQVKTPNYDYVPVETNEKTGITLGLVNPVFARDMKYSTIKLFADFPTHMGTDYEEMITKRGYTLRGPFQAVDDMVYNDKVACGLLLRPEININFDFSQMHRTVLRNAINEGTLHLPALYTYSGTVVIDGRINMIFCEPFTMEKIKVLSISIPQKTIQLSDPHAYGTSDFLEVISTSQEGAMMNPIITALEDIYQSTFKTAYNHLDPHEIADYLSDAKKVREKSNFMSK